MVETPGTGSQDNFNKGLRDFIQASPTPFHATSSLTRLLLDAGFERLHEGDAWQLQPGKRYVITRNDSSVIAFIYGRKPLLETGLRLVGAHTDSPCLKVKPKPEVNRSGYLQLGVEVYGGVLLAPWFDRDLSLAGRVSYTDDQG
jgi:aspartyl aminopeptidase